MEIPNYLQEATNALEKAQSSENLETVRIEYLGKKGKIAQLTQKIPHLPQEQRAEIGREVNKLKKEIEKALKKKKETLRQTASAGDWIDVTLPGLNPPRGHLHPQTQVLREIVGIFKQIGYQVAEGPEIETDWYNFEILNFPKGHPSRDTQMTLYLDTKGTTLNPGEMVLRTQTSAMQGRVMEKTKPPIRVIVPGKCFRYEQIDASHGFEFWQVEGFTVDKNICLADLFGTLTYVLKKLMGEETKLKFACTNFPFVEPGVDTYVECTVCEGRGCSFCKKSGWSEIMPAGMIHPFVLKKCDIDPEEYTGFAFAIGLSRVVTLRYKMDDLRLLVSPDLRILNQF